LEAVLFLSRQPLGSRRLAQLADLADGTEARTLVRLLNRLYDGRASAFRVEEVAGGFRLLTRAKFAPWLTRRHPMGVQLRFSGPALETLAVIAYRQPVMRADIEAIRGVQCDEVLRQLIEMDLVRVVGRAEELGRPLLYGTTRRFLEVFGLRHLEELPQLFSDGGYSPAGDGAAAEAQTNQQLLQSSQTVGEESNVKVLLVSDVLVEESVDLQFPRAAEHNAPGRPAGPAAYHDDEEDDFEDEDFEDEDEDYEDEDEDELEEDEEDFEDEDWEEVDDDEEEEEEEEEDDEEEWEDDWEEDEEEEDWEDDENDWEDEEEEEEEED
jgi:segregation and condensation protein B